MLDRTAAATDPTLSLRGVTKQYPGCLANDRVDLKVGSAEIHALLGENGAGKSTLVKIIYGVTRPDAGEIVWRGEKVTIESPAHARRLGIGMVFQHFSLFESLTVAENVALGINEPSERVNLRQRIAETSREYGLPLNPDRTVHDLSVGERQRIEIVRCLLQKSNRPCENAVSLTRSGGRRRGRRNFWRFGLLARLNRPDGGRRGGA